MSLSLLLPSRGRPDNLTRLATTALQTASNPEEIEIIVYADDDDQSYEGKEYPKNVQIYKTPRTTMSNYWNLAYEKATGPYYMMAADDIVFNTQDWDTKVKEAFDRYPDKVALIYGDDGDPNKDKNHATHPFLHKNWIDAVGYFTPPYFTSDFADTWLNNLADIIGRKEKIDIVTEHMHFAFGKGGLDLTHAERLVRHWKDDMPGLYDAKAGERKADAEKLREAINHA